MSVNGIGGSAAVYKTAMQSVRSINVKKTEVNDTKAEIQDKVEISDEGLEYFRNKAAIDENGDMTNEEAAEMTDDIEDMSEEIQSADEAEDEDDKETESEKSGGCVGINAQKLARMLAAAKTRSQVRSIITKIQSDLKECETGRAEGLDVDEASVAAAESLLKQAESKMNSVEDREATPEEELETALASLM
ncbi:MAG: hypothetical protein IJ740_10000 [Ruminococcus sp.]|nr:hypothetical protein [Ruminococcus sp.]